MTEAPERHPVHHPARAVAPRGPAQPVPLARLPLLGLLHRPRGRPRRTRRHHAGPCPRRAPHPAVEGLGALPIPLHQLRGQHQLDDGRDPLGRPGALVPAALPGGSWATPDPRRCVGDSSTHRAGSSTVPASASCASSTAGPEPTCCSAPTRRWQRSAERSHVSSDDTRLTTRAPDTHSGSKTATTNRVKRAVAIFDSSKWPRKPRKTSINRRRETSRISRD